MGRCQMEMHPSAYAPPGAAIEKKFPLRLEVYRINGPTGFFIFCHFHRV